MRRRKGVESLVDDPVEEISEGREGEPRLGLGGARRERTVGAGSSLFQGVEPQSTLADARFAPEDQGLRPRGDSIKERRDIGELGLPAEPGALHRPPPTRFGALSLSEIWAVPAVRPYPCTPTGRSTARTPRNEVGG